VVQADGLQTGLSQVVMAQITTNLARAGHPCRVLVMVSSPAGVSSGLSSDSVIMADNLATILESAIDRVVGVLPDPEMRAMDAALRHTLGI
jgi:mRNA interferase MazF